MKSAARMLEEVRRRRRPAARVVVAPGIRPRSLAVVSGAFHPPTLAHRALAERALRAGADAALFALGTVTLDKDATGLPLERRLELLEDLIAGDRRLGVVVHNAGLYADQAIALRRAMPGIRELAFVVGMDKLPQLFDPRYYDDIDEALPVLFRHAQIWVAPRGEAGYREFRALRAQPIARPHRERLAWLPLSPRWRAASATAVREALARGDTEIDALPDGWASKLREGPESLRASETPSSRTGRPRRRRARRPRRP